MHITLNLDPRIRDYVFIPLVILVFLVISLRSIVMKAFMKPENLLTKKITIKPKEEDDDSTIDISKVFSNIENEHKFTNALLRSAKIRTNADYIPENSLKLRKSFFCREETGYLRQKIDFNPLSSFLNPQMMTGMLKQNFSTTIFNIVLIMGVGYLFSGFILAKVPFPLTQKFRGMLQQGINLSELDVSYVSSMSWVFLLMFGIQDIKNLVFGENLPNDDMMMGNVNMMQMGGMPGAGGPQKDYNQIFEAERDNFELLSYNFKLENVEEELLRRYKMKEI